MKLGSVKMSYYLESIIVLLLHMMMIEKKISQFLVFDKGWAGGLNDATLTAKAEYFFIFIEQQKKLCSSLHYNGNNGLFVK